MVSGYMIDIVIWVINEKGLRTMCLDERLRHLLHYFYIICFVGHACLLYK